MSQTVTLSQQTNGKISPMLLDEMNKRLKKRFDEEAWISKQLDEIGKYRTAFVSSPYDDYFRVLENFYEEKLWRLYEWQGRTKDYHVIDNEIANGEEIYIIRQNIHIESGSRLGPPLIHHISMNGVQSFRMPRPLIPNVVGESWWGEPYAPIWKTRLPKCCNVSKWRDIEKIDQVLRKYERRENYLKRWNILEDDDKGSKIETSWIAIWGRKKNRKKTRIVSSTSKSNDKPTSVTVGVYEGNKMEMERTVDDKNRVKIKRGKQEQTEKDVYIYKAALTRGDMPCIIKLIVPEDAKIAIAQEESKVRVSKAIVIAIVPFTRKFIKMIGKILPIDAEVDINVEFPVVYEEIVYDFETKIQSAYSMVHKDALIYREGEEISVPDFDGDLEKVCVPGIHGYFTQYEALSWHGIPTITKEYIKGWKEMEELQEIFLK